MIASTITSINCGSVATNIMHSVNKLTRQYAVNLLLDYLIKRHLY
jgi:hypothetical protein